MPVHNSEIADLFETLADLLEIDEANPFRIRAYRNAARTLRAYPQSMNELIEQGQDLSELPTIGHDLAEKIQHFVATGHLPLLEEVQARLPAVLSDLMQIKGLGPKKIKTLYHKLHIHSLEELRQAARNGRVRTLHGFGEKSERNLLKQLDSFSGKTERSLLIEAADIAQALVSYLKTLKGINKVTLAGSYRRCRETVGDLDILVTAPKNVKVSDHFVKYDEVVDIVSHGSTRSTVKLRSGLSVDLRVVPEVSYGAALHYFTGSKSHNIAVRKLAVKKGLKINEYGVFKNDKRIAGRTESEVYRQVGLPYIEPELRENRGELEAARKGQLPELITREQIRGDLHCHSLASDGRNSLEEMADAAKRLGYEYLAITDHSQRVTVAHGLDEKRLMEQVEAIDRLNETLEDMVLLKSIEVDILEDGCLDLPDSVLKELDLTVCSIHSGFDLDEKKQTKRILKAMDHPCFNILAHPTGRLINRRPPYAVDLEKVMHAARERHCILEVNAQPLRLDLTETACQLAKEIGVKLAVSTDAHSSADLKLMSSGINQARRGWLEAADVVNTCSLRDLQTLLKR